MAGRTVAELLDGVHVLRLDDDRVKFFEAAWHIPEGITYNAYMIRGRGGWVLIDTWKGAYSGEFMDAVQEVADPREIKYIVVNHAEPDHSGSLVAIAAASPDAKIVVQRPGVGILDAMYGLGRRIEPAEGRMELAGEDFQFLRVPWVHWPETMMTYHVRTGILFTGDVFGSYSIPGRVDDWEPPEEGYLRYAEKYLVTVMGFHREHVLKALDALDRFDRPLAALAPAHGLVWRREISRIREFYRGWARGEGDPRRVLVAYASMYGSVEAAAGELAEELRSRGIRVRVHAITDSGDPGAEEFLTEANEAGALALATPTYDTGVHPMMKLLLDLLTSKFRGTGKRVALMASYGWGSRALEQMDEELREAGMNVVASAQFRERPAPGDLEKLADALCPAEAPEGA
ncbi:MAG: FprA family A-type flavoprotein [Conexivisphaera sp.]|jgi:flavorubredoxin|nr:FprA family A-type flavoprotein [Conexivisphaerales archaeon]